MVILVQLGFVVNRTEVGKAGVQPGAVKEGFDVVEDSVRAWARVAKR